MNLDFAKLIDKSARLAGQRVAGGHLDALTALDPGLDPGSLMRAAWRVAELRGEPALIQHPTRVHLPLVVHQAALGWAIITRQSPDGVWHGEDVAGGNCSFAALDELVCLALPAPPDFRPAVAGGASKPGALGLVLQALWAYKGVFLDAVLATCLVNLLTLAASLYSMQVYDRVIPNQGFSTLWVLTVGVALSTCLEFVLKQLRSRSVDQACNTIDHQLSEWFFRRMLGIRMEARPASVGTLASQVKGFELVRGVLASTSLFVLADVPFALFFLVVIGLVGGWVVAVPLISMPVALAAGLLFQHVIQRQTRRNLASSNRKAGLLVEAVDGVEGLKASSGEWAIQARWNQLVGETSESEQAIRNYAALAQNLTAALSQLSYISLVAVGAYFVAESQLTMGGLLACSIIGNRAMMPIVQLPGVMVQWAHARAAIEGLEKIIALPNEADDAATALVPQFIEGSIAFERVRFSYGATKTSALAIERLQIKAGECVGMLGAIGSGKSTLLKLASGMYRPPEGRVFLGGIDMALLSPLVVRETVGYLPQETRLFSGSLRDNLLQGLADPGEEAILAAARRTGLIDLILGQPKGLALEITEGGRGVSGGQMQLIALTRLLLAKPKVWLLDEPTGAMDSVTEGRIVGLLGELVREGVTLVVTTHKTALLPLVERLIVLQAGQVHFDGPRDPVLAILSGRPAAAVQEVAA